MTFATLSRVELRKMVDTRAGFWLQLTLAGLTLALVLLACLFARADTVNLRELFGFATLPANLLLFVSGLLLVSSEWSQRTALTTFALVPQRMRVMRAKLAAGTALGLVVLALVLAVVAVATAAVGGRWNLGPVVFGQTCLVLLSSIVSGIAFGAAFLRSAPAIVLSLALSLAWSALGFIPFLRDAAEWLDTARTTGPMTEHALSAHEWTHFAASQGLWLLLPLAIGLWRVARAEIA